MKGANLQTHYRGHEPSFRRLQIHKNLIFVFFDNAFQNISPFLDIGEQSLGFPSPLKSLIT